MVEEPWDAVIVRTTRADGQPDAALEDVRRQLETRRIPAVMVVPEPLKAQKEAKPSLIDYAPSSETDEALICRLTTLSRYDRLIKRMESELDKMQRLGKRLNQHFSEVDQEMRLASRLQRDFLPRLSGPIDGIRFEALFRPASWVSGDIYDVIRVDEEHVACYIADAVGHGMAASLLTMFIKQAIQPKVIDGKSYRVLDPSETLAILNDALAAHTLPNCQFVTAIYMVLNTRTRTLRLARGGHPHPLLIDAKDELTELQSQGGLLGIFPGESFVSEEVQLKPGDKVLLYTDGLELAFQGSAGGGKFDAHAYMKQLQQMAHLPIRELLSRINDLLDEDAGSLNPRDDVSVVAFEIPAD